MTEPRDLSTEILKQIRDELITTRTDLGARIDAVRTDLGARIDETNTRIDHVETTLVDLAEQQRFVVRHLSTLTERDRRLETEVDELRTRVDAIEERLPPR
jgi:chromosome segregation ATPase